MLRKKHKTEINKLINKRSRAFQLRQWTKCFCSLQSESNSGHFSTLRCSRFRLVLRQQQKARFYSLSTWNMKKISGKMKNSIKTRTNECWRRNAIEKYSVDWWAMGTQADVPGRWYCGVKRKDNKRQSITLAIESGIKIVRRVFDFNCTSFQSAIYYIFQSSVIKTTKTLPSDGLRLLFREINILRSASFSCAKESVKSS